MAEKKTPRLVKHSSYRSDEKMTRPVVKLGQQFDLFDERPLEMPGFKFKARRIEVVGAPSLDEWTRAFALVYAMEESSPFWIGDLWNYGEARSEWREQLPQALANIGLDLQIATINDYGSVARRVSSPRARAAAPSFSHAKIVADLSEEKQVALLEEAKNENMGRREFANRKREVSRRTVIEGQAELKGLYRVIYADPPWSYNDSGVITDSDAYGRAERHYKSLTIEDLCKLPVKAHTHEDSVMFLWVTSPMLSACWPVIEAWGFTYKTSIVWDKVLHNFGHYVSVRHEMLLICTRGSYTPQALVPMIDSVQTIRRGDVHSQKPQEFRQIIERLYPRGPYLELFGRERVKGWSVLGNDSRLWSTEATA